jgi:hypothetical protein
MTMAEQPDVRAAFRAEGSPAQFREFFDEWFLRHGVPGYAHAWMMSADEVARKMRQDPSGAWTGAAAAAANDEDNQPDHAAFLDGPTEPPSAANLARATGRANYRTYGSHYPCAFLDISDERAALSAIASGEARSALRDGVELLSPFIEVRLPDTRQSTAMLRLELAVPHALQDRLSVRLRVCDSIGQIGFSRRYSGRAIGAEPVVIPLLMRDLSPPRLNIAFALGGRPPATGRDAAIAFATLRSLQFWQVLVDTESASALPAGAA